MLLKIIILVFFITVSILNYRQKRKNIINIKKKTVIFLIIGLFSIVSTYICYKFDNSILGYLIVLSAIITIYTFCFYPGITKNGINIFLGTTPLIKFVDFSEISKIDLEENKNNELVLIIDVYGNTFKQIYNFKDKDEIEKLLKI